MCILRRWVGVVICFVLCVGGFVGLCRNMSLVSFFVLGGFKTLQIDVK